MITQSFFPVHSVCKSIVLEIKVIFPFLYSDTWVPALYLNNVVYRVQERAYSAKVRECNIQMFIFIFQHKQQQQQ